MVYDLDGKFEGFLVHSYFYSSTFVTQNTLSYKMFSTLSFCFFILITFYFNRTSMLILFVLRFWNICTDINYYIQCVIQQSTNKVHHSIFVLKFFYAIIYCSFYTFKTNPFVIFEYVQLIEKLFHSILNIISSSSQQTYYLEKHDACDSWKFAKTLARTTRRRISAALDSMRANIPSSRCSFSFMDAWYTNI